MEKCILGLLNPDFDGNILHVRDVKGGKDRTTVFPRSIQSELRQHLERSHFFITDKLPLFKSVRSPV
jgi:integrase